MKSQDVEVHDREAAVRLPKYSTIYTRNTKNTISVHVVPIVSHRTALLCLQSPLMITSNFPPSPPPSVIASL